MSVFVFQIISLLSYINNKLKLAQLSIVGRFREIFEIKFYSIDLKGTFFWVVRVFRDDAIFKIDFRLYIFVLSICDSDKIQFMQIY